MLFCKGATEEHGDLLARKKQMQNKKQKKVVVQGEVLRAMQKVSTTDMESMHWCEKSRDFSN